MAYTDKNNITLNSFDGDIFPRIKKVGNNQNRGATIDDLSDIASENGGNLPTIVNAVEIDWKCMMMNSIIEFLSVLNSA